MDIMRHPSWDPVRVQSTVNKSACTRGRNEANAATGFITCFPASTRGKGPIYETNSNPRQRIH